MPTIPIKSLPNGFSLPVFGVGTWMLGGGMTRDPQNDDAADIRSLKNALENGFTHFDTAELYAAGHAETLLGQALQGYDRSKLFLVSKILAPHLGRRDVRKALLQSLKRLQTEYLDLYFIHHPNPQIPIEETMEALDELVDEGLIRHIGVSNFALPRLLSAEAATRHSIAAIQVHYNLIYREIERASLLEHCQQQNIMLIAWRPVQKGLLASDKSPLMSELCHKYEKTPAQIAINWLISQKNVVTLATMRDDKHREENLGGIDWKMAESDIERLRREYPDQKFLSDAVPLR